MPALSSIGDSSIVPLGSGSITYAVTIRADKANGGKVYVGLNSNVTAGTSDATDGMPLDAGDTITIPAGYLDRQSPDLAQIYLLSESGHTSRVFFIKK